MDYDFTQSRVFFHYEDVSTLFMRFGKCIAKYKTNKDSVGVFARRIEREKPHLKTFREYADVDPTNNFAERGLRFAVTWRKRSLGTTSEKGDRFVERILSLRHTCRLQERSTFAILLDISVSHAKGLVQNTAWLTDEPVTP